MIEFQKANLDILRKLPKESSLLLKDSNENTYKAVKVNSNEEDKDSYNKSEKHYHSSRYSNASLISLISPL